MHAKQGFYSHFVVKFSNIVAAFQIHRVATNASIIPRLEYISVRTPCTHNLSNIKQVNLLFDTVSQVGGERLCGFQGYGIYWPIMKPRLLYSHKHLGTATPVYCYHQ